MSDRNKYRKNKKTSYRDKATPKPLTALEIAARQLENLKARKRQEYIDRKVAHWARMGTQTEISPITGAAVPKWKLAADKAEAKRIIKACSRHCRRYYLDRAAV